MLERVIDAARHAPFGTRRDERALVVLTGDEKGRLVEFLQRRLEEVVRAMSNGPSRQTLSYAHSLADAIGRAPVLVAVFTAVGREGPELSIASAACAVQNLMLAAYAEGLASCYMTGALYLGDEIAYLLGLADCRLIGLVPLGYPDQQPGTRKQFPAVAWRGFKDHDPGETPVPMPRTISDVQRSRPGTGERVLVVTDTPEIDAPIAECLQRAGYTVSVVEPTGAVEAFTRDRPEVTIIDAILGEISGYDLAREISKVMDGPAPVIITTAAYDEADEEEALASGAIDVITKPVRDHELLARVRSLADNQALYEQTRERAEQLERTNEQLRELQRLRDDLTHMIVHDMRTPLTNIITGLQTVVEVDYDPDLTREFVPEAVSAGMDLLDMINNLLDISRMEAGELEPQCESIELRALVEECFERVDHLASENDLNLTIEVAEGLTLTADRALLKRVIMNLLGNAIKFTPEGGSVTVEAHETDEGTQVCVRDTGPGIPREQQAQLFRMFSQLEGAKKSQGTGLGLAFVRMAVEAHGGRVWVDSEVGKGSSFCFVIPDGSAALEA